MHYEFCIIFIHHSSFIIHYSLKIRLERAVFLSSREVFPHINGAGEENYRALDYIEHILIYGEEIKTDENYL